MSKISKLESASTFNLAWFVFNDQDEPYVGEKYRKIEIGVELPAALNDKIEAFFSKSSKSNNTINPFNKNDISIDAEFYKDQALCQSRPGFYYQEYQSDLQNNQWVKDTTSYTFRIRFCPPEKGNYFAKITLKAKNLDPIIQYFEFQVEDSNKPGYLEKGTHSKHMRFSSSKESFFGVGQEIPWASWEDWGRMDRAVGPKKFHELYPIIKSFSEAGGNFTRFVATPWFMQLEWEALGNYLPKMGQAREFDRITEYCEELDVYFLFCALLHSPLESRTDENDGVMPGVRWEKYCYNDADKTPSEVASVSPIGLSEPIDFYKSLKAQELTKNYFRYLVARYGYSTALAGWQVMSEVDETAQYRDNSEYREYIRKWTENMTSYIREELTERHLTGIAIIKGKGYSKTLWDPELFKLPFIDFFGFHDYIYETSAGNSKTRNRNLLIRYPSVNELNTGFQNGSISYPEFQQKMFIYDEFGHILTTPRKLPEDLNNDPTIAFNNCADFMIKQDLWFTLSSGCAVSGLDWWNHDQSKRQEMWNKYYPAIQSFMNDVDFEKYNFSLVRKRKGNNYIAQRWPQSEKEILRSGEHEYSKDDLLESYTQVSSDGSMAFGWMSNRSVNWYNLIDEYPCLNSLEKGTDPYHISYIFRPGDDDKIDRPIDIESNVYFIKITNLKNRTEYTIDFYSTTSGLKLSSGVEKSNSKGIIKLYAPEMDHKSNPDVAYKIIEKKRDR